MNVSRTQDPADLSATEVLAAYRSGALDPVRYAQALSARSRARDPAISAWAAFDEEAFLDAMRRISPGPLSGLPVAVKDIFDTFDMPTACGSPLLAGRRPRRDAAAVAAIRAAGGVVMGKTVTTEFASAYPGPTRNPHDPARTPGGSSSGSAAAVAAGIAPLAVGSQTAGSIIRPAAYCGVTGFKPSFGRINRTGCLSFSESLDTIGDFARTVEDAWLLAEVMAGAAQPSPLRPAPRPPRIGVCETPEWDLAAPETLEAIDRAIVAARTAGATVRKVPYPALGPALLDAQKTIMNFEAARAFAHETRAHPGGLSAQLSALLAEGATISADAYAAALDQADDTRRSWAATFDDIDLVLSASTIGEAPIGLDHTGDPLFSRVWTLLHGPCLHLPTGSAPSGMPTGVQLIGRNRTDAAFMRNAMWMAYAIGLAQPTRDTR